MVEVKITPQPDHVLPAKFWGFNFSIGYYAGDLFRLAEAPHPDEIKAFSENQLRTLASGQYRQLLQDVAPEVWRTHDFKRSNGALYSGFTDAKRFMLATLPNAAAILNPDSGPASLPSTVDPCSPTNLAAPGSGRSPSDHAKLAADWLDAGIHLELVEPYNELWGHCRSGPAWYGGSGLDADGFKCESWGSIHQRDFYREFQKVFAARGAKTKVGGHVLASSEGYGWSWTQSFIDADAIRGACSSPFKGPGANLPYFDDYVHHGYPAGANWQDRLGSLLVDVSSAPPNGTSLYSKLQDTRKRLNAAGGSAKGITVDEAGVQDVGSIAGLFDVLYAIIVSRNQARFGLSRFLFHSGNTAAATNLGIYPLFLTNDHVTFTETTHSCVLRDIVSPFLGKYKRQCIPVVSGSDLTPGAFQVAAVQASSGLDEAGEWFGVLAGNFGLDKTRQVAFDIGAAPAGDAVVTLMRQGQQPGPTPKSKLPANGTVFTVTLDPGAAVLLEIPLSTAPPPPPPGPPPNPELAAALDTLKQGTLWHNPNLGDPRHPCKGYADANPGESATVAQYIADVAAGKRPAPPQVATYTGQGLVALVAALVDDAG